MLVIGRRENDHRQAIRRQLAQHLKAIHAGHLHIQKEQLRRVAPNLFQGLRPAAAFADNLDFRFVPQQMPDAFPGERFVVHNERA